MSINPLNAIMNPKTIAMVGASNNFTTMGTIQLLNLLHSGFPGEVLPVHTQEKEVLGRKAYREIAELPYVPDLAVLVVPTRLVAGMLEDFGRLGTRHAVIISAGFKETGSGGDVLEKDLVDIADRYSIRFLGPNCLGIINTHLPLNITVGPVRDLNGCLGIVSQSGTYVGQVVNYLHVNGIVPSKAISVGNEANMDITDCLEYLGEDEATKAIGLYIEGIRDASRFLDAARKITPHKPIVAQYVGGTEAGARSVSSHTGAMAGPDHVYDGLFEQAGIIRVDTIEDVYKMGWALATQPPLKGPNIAVLTNSGGPGSGIASTCNRYGLSVPEFSEKVQEDIGAYLPGHASAKNPVDLTFHIDMSALADKIPQILFDADGIDGIIIHGIMGTGFLDMLYPTLKDHIPLSRDEILQMFDVSLDRLTHMPAIHGKPLFISSFMNEKDNFIKAFRKDRIPVFDCPETTAKAMGALYRHLLIRLARHDEPGPTGKAPQEASTILNNVGSGVVDEYNAKRLLSLYGIPVTREELAHGLEDCLDAADRIGFPVAMKICSVHVAHKTEQGMVCLDIEDKNQLECAYRSLREKDSDSNILISEMLAGEREFMAGISTYPGFPPCVMFGVGGIFTEAFHDISIRLSPIGRCDAQSMLDSISASRLIEAYRNMPPVDRDCLEDILISLGRLSLHFPQIKEIDLNPIITVQGRPKVADALIILEDL